MAQDYALDVGATNILSLSLSLSLSQVVKNGSDTECSYWDQALDGGYGAWSTEGCSLVDESYDKATCECNHLTNFAVLRVSLHALFKLKSSVILRCRCFL